MQRIINFILRNKNTLLYALLLLLALFLTIQNNDYHQTRYFNSANWLTGRVYKTSESVQKYFSLREENTRLQEENRRLHTRLYNLAREDSIELDTSGLTYSVLTARVIKNSYAEANNYLTIDKGKRHGVVQDMGVITPRGILGIVERSSNGFASVQSVLNAKSNINAKIGNTDYFGSLTWNQKDYRLVQLEDIPRLVPLKVGDTIVTGAMSSIFPENIPIGTIENFTLSETDSFYQIDVRLFNDMTSLGQVYLILNRKRPEILELENQTRNDR